jgi:hypothetical protein
MEMEIDFLRNEVAGDDRQPPHLAIVPAPPD